MYMYVLSTAIHGYHLLDILSSLAAQPQQDVHCDLKGGWSCYSIPTTNEMKLKRILEIQCCCFHAFMPSTSAIGFLLVK